MHRSVLLRLGLAGFLGGVTAASFAFIHPAVPWALVAVGSIAVLIGRPRLVAAGVVVLAASVGMWRTTQVLERPSPLWELAADAPSAVVDGIVDGDFSLTASGRGKWTLRALRVTTDAGTFAVDDRIVVYGLEWVRPLPGQALALTGKLQRPENTSDFDYISYLRKDGIHAQMHFPQFGVPDAPLAIPLSSRLLGPLYAVRDSLERSIDRAVPGAEGGYLAGILLGARGGIDAALKEAFSRTGTSHILAISGYNITIIASVLMALLRRFGRTRSYWLTVAGVAAFTLMVGASASVVRAAIMGILALTAVHMGRRAAAGPAILSAAALMCALNPLLLRWDVGFQLSFLAVLGIVYVEPLLAPALKRTGGESLGALAATTLAAQVMVLPLILYDFGTLAVYTLPVNLLVLPLVPLAMALGLATGLAGLVLPFLGALIGQVAWLVAAVQLAIVRLGASLPYAALTVSIGAPLMLALYAGIVTWLVSWYNSAAERSLKREEMHDPRRVVRHSGKNVSVQRDAVIHR